MIFRNLPALVTLIASLMAFIITFVYRYDLTKSLIIILVSAIVFFIAGMIARSLLNRFLVVEEASEGEDKEEDNGEEETLSE